ncbi:MAG: hypothetical protein VB853_04565 [Pirellulales bacterium]
MELTALQTELSAVGARQRKATPAESRTAAETVSNDFLKIPPSLPAAVRLNFRRRYGF